MTMLEKNFVIMMYFIGEILLENLLHCPRAFIYVFYGEFHAEIK